MIRRGVGDFLNSILESLRLSSLIDEQIEQNSICLSGPPSLRLRPQRLNTQNTRMRNSPITEKLLRQLRGRWSCFPPPHHTSNKSRSIVCPSGRYWHTFTDWHDKNIHTDEPTNTHSGEPPLWSFCVPDVHNVKMHHKKLWILAGNTRCLFDKQPRVFRIKLSPCERLKKKRKLCRNVFASSVLRPQKLRQDVGTKKSVFYVTSERIWSQNMVEFSETP